MVRRWQQLPLDHALACAPRVRELLDDLAADTAPGAVVPDLGPAVLMDQLTVLVHDACEAGRVREGGRPGERATRHTDLAQRLTTLRRSFPGSR